ncbi:MAG: hypothetical protein SPH36_03050, partial [Candidatus Cryptobacteroides sp.]|nr:hypothetical protein [Candidatus Cryptobacteroides sp.]
APVVGPSGRGSAPPSRPNDLNSTTKITHSIFFYPSVSTFTSAAMLSADRLDSVDWLPADVTIIPRIAGLLKASAL